MAKDILRVARTIADLESCDQIKLQHIAEAVGYGSLYRSAWIWTDRIVQAIRGTSCSFSRNDVWCPCVRKALERCVRLSAISSLLQKGDSRVMSLGHPSYPPPKGTRNHSMAEKRGYVEIGETGPRKTRVAWSKLDRLNPNPDRGLSYSVVRPIEHDVIECRPFPFRGYGKPAR